MEALDAREVQPINKLTSAQMLTSSSYHLPIFTLPALVTFNSNTILLTKPLCQQLHGTIQAVHINQQYVSVPLPHYYSGCLCERDLPQPHSTNQPSTARSK